MDEVIDISLERLTSIILELDPARFSTADVIRGYCGGFFSNAGTPAHYSLNAQFGKLLKRNEGRLGIERIEADVAVKDDQGRPTNSSFWQRTNVKS